MTDNNTPDDDEQKWQEYQKDKKLFTVSAALFALAGIMLIVFDWLIYPLFRTGQLDHKSARILFLLLPAYLFRLSHQAMIPYDPAEEKRALLKMPSKSFVISLVLILTAAAAVIGYGIEIFPKP